VLRGLRGLDGGYLSSHDLGCRGKAVESWRTPGENVETSAPVLIREIACSRPCAGPMVASRRSVGGAVTPRLRLPRGKGASRMTHHWLALINVTKKACLERSCIHQCKSRGWTLAVTLRGRMATNRQSKHDRCECRPTRLSFLLAMNEVRFSFSRRWIARETLLLKMTGTRRNSARVLSATH